MERSDDLIHERINDLILEGWNLRDSGKFDQALYVFNEALKIDPNIAMIYLGRGLSYLGKNNCQQAMQDFETALRIDPNNPSAARELKKVQEKLGINTYSQESTTLEHNTSNKNVQISENLDHTSSNAKTSQYPLISFAGKSFMLLYEISLWLILFGSGIGVAALFGMLDGYTFHVGLAILGLFVGLLVGLVIVVILGGLVAVFLIMAEDIEKIKQSDNRKN